MDDILTTRHWQAFYCSRTGHLVVFVAQSTTHWTCTIPSQCVWDRGSVSQSFYTFARDWLKAERYVSLCDPDPFVHLKVPFFKQNICKLHNTTVETWRLNTTASVEDDPHPLSIKQAHSKVTKHDSIFHCQVNKWTFIFLFFHILDIDIEPHRSYYFIIIKIIYWPTHFYSWWFITFW